MDLYDIGFSNIRLPNDKNNYTYIYSHGVNEFPEEVMLHEFLHSLERVLLEYGYDIPALHDYDKYGYEEERVIGFKKWYEAYMSKRIVDFGKNEYIGLDPIVYTLKPVHRSDFEIPITIDFYEEPQNLKEDVAMILKVIKNALTGQPI